MVNREVAVKHKEGNAWRTTMEPMADLDKYRGREVVAKISDAVMWCGTEQWRQHYLMKGYVATNSADLIEVAELAHAIFRGNREERVSIMEESGAITEQAHEYCNSKPDVYGYKQMDLEDT